MTTAANDNKAWRSGLALIATIAIAAMTAALATAGARKGPVPRFAVDPSWPKPLPDRWVTGEIGGVCVDSKDHVFGVNRGNLDDLEKITDKTAAPPVIEYDAAGNVVNAWGDPAVLPPLIHGCFVDDQDNVWIAGAKGGVVQKWSHDGKTLLMSIGDRARCDGPGGQCGEPGLNASKTLLNAPADIAVDHNGDIYIADGYGNDRVAVFDKTGRFLRQMGSAGAGPAQFSATVGGHPHCVALGRDGLLYTCDRPNDRINVFTKMGVFLRAIPVKPGTGISPKPDGSPGRVAVGSALDIAFSPDPAQTWLYVADLGNDTVWIMERATGKIVGGFGGNGHNAGGFTILHMLAADSKGNIYTSETISGRRLQKFTPRGVVPDKDLKIFMGSPWYFAAP